MDHQHRDTLRRRIDAVRQRAPIKDVVGAVVKLGKGRKPRGQCPFHGSKSDSFATDPDNARARCWGCGWTGDVVKFVQEYYRLSFIDALKRLEEDHGLDGLSAAPIARAKAPVQTPERESVPSVVMGRWIWKNSRSRPKSVRTYLMSRAIPAEVLTDERLADIRFCARAPLWAWPANRSPKSIPHAPAMVALIRRVHDRKPIGVHVTYLAPDLAGKMVRLRGDGKKMDARKMLGAAGGGAVFLPGAGSTAEAIAPAAPLFVGEGIETVFSGIVLNDGGSDACGMATLSLGNLQGEPLLIRGALPIYDPRPDPDRPPVGFAHPGPVIGLMDADMAPKRGARDQQTGDFVGELVIERKGARAVRRAISSAERTAICAALFTHGWRKRGCGVRVLRPPMGMDCNDVLMRERKACLK